MCYVSVNIDFLKIDNVLLSIPPENTFPHRVSFMWPSPFVQLEQATRGTHPSVLAVQELTSVYLGLTPK